MYTHYYVFILITSTILTAVFIDTHVPYFPIEISRTASGGWAYYILSFGTIPLILTSYADKNKIDETRILMIFSIFIIAYYDDKKYLYEHQIGVLLLMLSFLYNAIKSEHQNANLMIFLTCLIFYILRMIIKASFVLILVFKNDILNFYTWYNFLTTRQFIQVYEVCTDIMYNGDKSNYLKDNTDTIYLLNAFRLCGMIQWIIFWFLSVTVK